MVDLVDVLTALVRYAHILAAILWIGGLGFAVMVLGPSLRKTDQAAAKGTMRHLIPLSNRFIPRVAIATIVFGTILWYLIGGMNGGLFGEVMSASLILAIALLVFGLAVVRRSGMAILTHLNEADCTHGPEVGVLQRTLGRGQVIALVWGFAILALMVYATGSL